MNRTKQLLLGLVTVLPLVYLVYFMIAMFKLRIPFDLMIKMQLGAAVVIIALLIYYIRHVYTSKVLQDNKKTMWLIILFFGYPISMPVYWYLNIWKSESVQ